MNEAVPSSNNLLKYVQRWWPRVALILFILLALYVIFAKEGGIIRVMELKNENDRLKTELQELSTEKERLIEQIQRLKAGDPELIEEEARRNGMIREGETVYRLQYKEIPGSTGIELDKNGSGGK